MGLGKVSTIYRLRGFRFSFYLRFSFQFLIHYL
jgi:hypothetical protein